jgi:P2 family phage contractile tail tube protein
MALPKKLKNMNVFNDGISWLGEVAEVQLPKLARKFEDYRAAGMDGAVGVDMGMENLEMEITAGGFITQALLQFGSTKVDGVSQRFAGAYQQEDTGQVTAYEIYMRGRWQEVDMGKAKPGDDTEVKLKARLAYYRLVANGVDLIEIDLMGMVFKVNGVDILEEQRRAIGLA